MPIRALDASSSTMVISTLLSSVFGSLSVTAATPPLTLVARLPAPRLPKATLSASLSSSSSSRAVAVRSMVALCTWAAAPVKRILGAAVLAPVRLTPPPLAVRR